MRNGALSLFIISLLVISNYPFTEGSESKSTKRILFDLTHSESYSPKSTPEMNDIFNFLGLKVDLLEVDVKRELGVVEGVLEAGGETEFQVEVPESGECLVFILESNSTEKYPFVLAVESPRKEILTDPWGNGLHFHEFERGNWTIKIKSRRMQAYEYKLRYGLGEVPHITRDVLRGYDVLVLMGPRTKFSREEVSAIREFVEGGGKLIYVQEGTKTIKDANEILKGTGIEFVDSLVLDKVYNLKGSPHLPIIFKQGESEIARGIRGVRAIDPVGMKLSGNAMGLAYFSDESFLDSNWNEMPDQNEERGLPCLASSSLGKGEVIVVCDSDFFNTALVRGLEGAYQFLLNIFAYASGERAPLVVREFYALKTIEAPVLIEGDETNVTIEVYSNVLREEDVVLMDKIPRELAIGNTTIEIRMSVPPNGMVKYSYRIKANKPGRYLLQPALIKIGEEIIRTGGIELNVLPKESKASHSKTVLIAAAVIILVTIASIIMVTRRWKKGR